MADPLVIQALERWRQQVQAQEAGMMREMTRRWLGVEDKLRGEMLDLSLYLDELRAKGEEITTARLLQMERYQRLIADARVQEAEFARWAADLTAGRQSVMAGDGVSMAQEAIRAAMADVGWVGAAFNHINVNAVNILIGFATDGSPLVDLLRASYPETVMKLTDDLVQGLASGMGTRATARLMADDMAGNLDRALTIARTEQLRALREGNRAQMAQSGVVIGWIRRAQRSGNVCLACLSLDGQEYETDEILSEHPNCLVPGVLVTGAIPEYFMSRDYKGDVLSIRTASGNFLTVTPKHPILTDRGWVAAQFLMKGDNVIASEFSERTGSSIDPNNHHVPTLIENIPQTFNLVRLGSVPVSPEDFHGDGKHSDINVVFANRLLLNNRHVISSNPISQLILSIRDISGSAFSSFGSFAKILIGSLFSSDCIVGRGCTSTSLLGGGFRISHQLRFGQTANMNTLADKSTTNNRTGNLIFEGKFLLSNAHIVELGSVRSKSNRISDSWSDMTKQAASLDFFREMLFGKTSKNSSAILDPFPAQIHFDRIVDIGVSTFVGHVYNLQNKDGWYISNNIITHNCACFMQPKLKYGKTPEFPSGPEWFGTLGKEQLAAMLGPARYKLYQAGGLDWGKVAQIHEDPVWGREVRIATMDELAD
jgi:hypothetical protein